VFVFRTLLAAAVLFLTVVSAPKADDSTKVVHVYVALCDNANQGIVPVSAELGNGQSARTNLYWGAMYGVKTFLHNSPDWRKLTCRRNPRENVLDRCVFRSRDSSVIVVAEAYDGAHIRQTVTDFLEAASGAARDTLYLAHDMIVCGGASDLVVYVGHNGLMDFSLDSYPKAVDSTRRDVIILACASKSYFGPALDSAGAYPLLWTTGLMAPEAYTLHAAIGAWAKGWSDSTIAREAAAAYHHYQTCGLRAAQNLLVTGR